jgi:hypothetical protein
MNKGYYKDVLTADGKPYMKLAFDDTHDSRFWVDLMAKDKETRQLKFRGKVKMQVDILPIELAEKNTVGKARDSPNHSPTLPQPEGRISLSLNPFKMFEQMVGPEVRAKICRVLACIACLALCAAILPTLAGSLISDLILGLFK